MTVVYVNARFLTQELTGVQRFAQEISLELKRQLPDVRFVCPANIKHQALAETLGAEVIGSRTGHAWEQIDLPRTLRQRGKPLLVNLMSTAPVAYSNQMATLHDVNYVRFPKSFSRSFVLFYRLLIPLILKRIKLLITVSEFSKREIAGYYGFPENRILVAPNAVNQALQLQHAPKPGPRYILAVSSPNLHKNFGALIEAFLALDAVADGVSLYVVGKANGSFRSQKLDAAQASDRVTFLGRVDDAQLSELYAGALAFAFPSLYEGFGIPPLEAQLNDCPVVSSNAASMPEVLGDSALFFDPTNVGDIQRALADIIANGALRAELVEKGRANVARFSWQRSAEKVAEAVRRLS